MFLWVLPSTKMVPISTWQENRPQRPGSVLGLPRWDLDGELRVGSSWEVSMTFFYTFFGKGILFVEFVVTRCGCSLDVFLRGWAMGVSSWKIWSRYFPSNLWPGEGRWFSVWIQTPQTSQHFKILLFGLVKKKRQGRPRSSLVSTEPWVMQTPGGEGMARIMRVTGVFLL